MISALFPFMWMVKGLDETSNGANFPGFGLQLTSSEQDAPPRHTLTAANSRARERMTWPNMSSSESLSFDATYLVEVGISTVTCPPDAVLAGLPVRAGEVAHSPTSVGSDGQGRQME